MQVDKYFGNVRIGILNRRAIVILLIISYVGLFVPMYVKFVRFMNFFFEK